ncbi:MAG: type II toxin-antitoxin system VapC family toxin [Spirochaetaceae bacterium]|nr:MAG: type II toxin-antitoxin system VapC family toxin [Spirochaetaceae bacterium]
MTTLVDANVLLDLFTDDPRWCDWSRDQLSLAMTAGTVAINPIIYAELCYAFARESELELELTRLQVERLELPYSAAWRASEAFVRYRRSGGTKRSPLPDFFIGAHAESAGLPLLTRDEGRYRTYFPAVRLIRPER